MTDEIHRMVKKTPYPQQFDSVEDCLELRNPYSEAEILANLSDRYARNIVFTSVGSTTTLNVNPRVTLESFSEGTSQYYVDSLKSSAKQPAHIFQLAENAYRRMLAEEQDQSILLLGDAASGKSEFRKLIARHLCNLSRKSKKTSSSGVSKTTKLTQNILKAETILEAFGHARTSGSPSEPRYSRYTEFQYDKGKIIGCKTLDYLLEKHRAVGQYSSNERNFNIFYLLISGASEDERTQFFINESSVFHYLGSNKAKASSFASTDDKLKFLELRDHFKSLGFTKRLQNEIFSIVAAILHLGNVQFLDDPNNRQEAAYVKNYEPLEMAAQLLGVAPADLEITLTYKTKLVDRELFNEFLNAEDAAIQRDVLCMTLYSLLFSWILERINVKLCKEDCENFISLIDFASVDMSTVKEGRFDHLLLNYSNEKLLQFFQKRVFKDTLEELKSELIVNSAQNLSCKDNKNLVDFLDSQLLPAIDKASSQCASTSTDPKHVDLLNNLIQSVSSSSHFYTTPTRSSSQANFQVMHSLGPIDYSTGSMIDANLDVLCPDFVTLFRGDSDKGVDATESTLIRNLFSDSLVSAKKHWKNQNVLIGAATSKKPSRQPSVRRKRAAQLRGDQAEKTIVPTLWSSFKSSLDDMFDTVQDTISWYALCFSPNVESYTHIGSLDRRHIQTQMSQMGVCSLIESRLICRDFSVAIPADEFLERFKFFKVTHSSGDSVHSASGFKSGNPAERVIEFMTKKSFGESDYGVGKSGMIYLKESVYQNLVEEARSIREEMKAKSKENRANWRHSFADDESILSSDMDGSDYEDSNYEASIYEGVRQRNATNATVEIPLFDQARKKQDIETPAEMSKEIKEEEPEKKTSGSRKCWLSITWCLTWWIPGIFLSCCGGMKRPEIRMAWREKVALCLLIFLACASLLFFIVGLGRVVCPPQAMLSAVEVQSKSSLSDLWVYAYGRVYQINDIKQNHIKSYQVKEFEFAEWSGKDVSSLFYKAQSWDRYCPGITKPQPADWDNINDRPNRPTLAHNRTDPSTGAPKLYLESMNKYAQSRLVWDWDYLGKTASSNKRLLVIYNNVYDVSSYFNMNNSVFGPEFLALFTSRLATNKQDATDAFNSLKSSIGPDRANRVLNCMNNMFYIGNIDIRNSVQCQLSNYILLAASCVIVLLLLVKFLAALQFGSGKEPEDHDRFVIIQVPCYTEGPESLTRTLESLAVTRYDDKRKLIFVICDGMIIGSGNDRPTPRIVLDILGVNAEVDPEPLDFYSLGEGDKQHNMGKVYSGLYEVNGHAVPYIVVVKVGKASERQKPGNRGKRDSQMMLMRFLSRVHFNSSMSPLELEVYRHMKNIIGVNPSFYEYIMMVDADTEVDPLSLNRMVSSMIHDSKIMGLCGETLLSNEKDSWITMIQVYEYFISHHLAKAFESLFGSVTCLPGCFCMYRIRTPTKNVPLLVSPAVINDYAENEVDTLHLKNLLHLGEDRYLTTLMMKHFPNMKLTFTNDATCRTYAPDRWAVLLSQRRRWINSTVHNLFELLSLQQLCGMCCFSMRFVVFMDLFSTIVQPAAVGYIAYLLYSLITNTGVFPLTSLLLLVAVYGLQVIIFILKQQYAQIGWMIVYLLAMPVFSFYIPVYSFWHMDDFSWGNTRVVVGDNGKTIKYTADVKKFDPNSINLKKWSDFEAENAHLAEQKSHSSHPSRENGSFYEESNYGGSNYKSSAVMMTPPPVSYPPSAYSSAAAPFAPQMPIDNRVSMLSLNSQFMNNTAVVPVTTSSQRPLSGFYSPMGMPSAPASPSRTRPASPAPRSPATPNSGQSPVSPQSIMTYGQQPSDAELLNAMKRMLASANLMNITKKQVREELSKMFGVDLTSRKATINSYIDDILQGRL